MTIGGTILVIIIIGVVMIAAMYNQYKKGRTDMLEDMFTAKDIDSDTYRKYKKIESE